MQVNHLGHFLLTMLLEEALQKAAAEPDSDVRIVNVSSDGHKFTMQKGNFTQKLLKYCNFLNLY